MNFIDEEYIEIFANDEAAKDFVDLAIEEKTDVEQVIVDTTKSFENLITIVATKTKEHIEAQTNADNKDKEVFDGQTEEQKE